MFLGCVCVFVFFDFVLLFSGFCWVFFGGFDFLSCSFPSGSFFFFPFVC